MASASLARRVHRDRELLRHGLGGDLAGHLRRAADRGRTRRLGAQWWQAIFFEGHETFAKLWGPIVGPLVAIVSFVCSIGNVPLAAVLWNGGISFGGVVAFIFADLLVLPILDIYRKYYGWRMAAFLLATFYAVIVAAGLIVELLFQGLGLVPAERNAKVETASVQLNHTTVLNVIFLALAAVLVVRYFRRGGGLSMLRMMNRPIGEHDHGAAANRAG